MKIEQVTVLAVMPVIGKLQTIRLHVMCIYIFRHQLYIEKVTWRRLAQYFQTCMLI